jgi:hypothetical protein
MKCFTHIAQTGLTEKISINDWIGKLNSANNGKMKEGSSNSGRIPTEYHPFRPAHLTFKQRLDARSKRNPPAKIFLLPVRHASAKPHCVPGYKIANLELIFNLEPANL